ncbi:MAG: glycosyltransferase family 4 protein [Acidobacteria bacterium]|nr:glycosyltransferase family 4 protein [Acidobacteriota bacterium]
MRICICATQIPFSRGGAEIHVESLHRELLKRDFDAELVTVPFSWNPRLQILKSAVAWRLLDLETMGGAAVDLVIATRFPSYMIEHANKVVWLIHQFRQVYDLFGTPYSDFEDSPEDRSIIDKVRRMDNRALSEARGLYTNAANTAARLKQFNGLDATPLHVPPQLGDDYREGPFGDYLFSAGRLDRMKRVDLLIETMRHVESEVRCKIAGIGPEREALAEKIARAGLADRVELLGWVDDATLLELYANSLAVFYAPYDEDYGYITVEAFKSGKPVLTATDSGGVLEFVEEGRTGFMCEPESPASFARRVDELFADRERAAELGRAGAARVMGITWDRVIETLTGRQD